MKDRMAGEKAVQHTLGKQCFKPFMKFTVSFKNLLDCGELDPDNNTELSSVDGCISRFFA
jgi:hypothetical protein